MKSSFKIVCMIIEDNSAIEYQIQFSGADTGFWKGGGGADPGNC